MKLQDKIDYIRLLTIKNQLEKAFELSYELGGDADHLDKLRLLNHRLSEYRSKETAQDASEELEVEKNQIVIAFLRWLSLSESTNKSEADQKLAEYYYEFGGEQIRNEKYKQALEYFKKAIEAYPEHVQSYLERGAAHIALGNWQEGLEDFTRVIELDSNEPHGYYNRGMVYYQLGKKQEALDDWLQIKLLGSNLADREIEIVKHEL